MQEGLIIGIVVVGIGLVIAAMRSGSSLLGTKTGQMKSFVCVGGAAETLKSIIRYAQQVGYKISAMDEAHGQLVLEESASVTSWGFFLPVYVTRQSENTTLVEVGIKSKLIQFGPLKSRSHEKCVNGIKAALLAQGVNN